MKGNILFFLLILFILINGTMIFKETSYEGLESKDWKVNVDTKNNLSFEYKGKPVTTITKTGEVNSKQCNCGQWNIRDSRMGIPGRNDINMHSDGWVRLLAYNSPELTDGKHQRADYLKGGWAGKELWYNKTGGGRLHVA